MQALVITPAHHDAAGEFVHDQHLPVLYHIIDVPVHDAVGLNRLVDMVQIGGVFHIHQVIDLEKGLGFFHARRGQSSGAGFFIYDVVSIHVVVFFLGVQLFDLYKTHFAHKLVSQLVQVGGFGAGAGDNQRRPGLVNQNRVHFVYNGIMMSPLYLVFLTDGHVITQIVKPHLVIGSVGDVGGIGLPPLVRIEVVDDKAHRKA